jgi:rhodanese-related sulfurtransferase
MSFLLQGCFKNKHIYIEAHEFEKLYKTRKIFPVLVDTRLLKEYENGHIDYAINIPSKELFNLNTLSEIKERINAKKHTNWVLFLYAQNNIQTVKLKEKIEKLYKNNFKSPNTIYYLKGGYEKLLKSS